MAEMIGPGEVDRRLGWGSGQAKRLARRRMLPCYVIPDGSFRFVWTEIEPLLKRIEATESPELKRVREKLLEVARRKGRQVSPEIDREAHLD